MSSDRYEGARPDRDEKTKHASLKSTGVNSLECAILHEECRQGAHHPFREPVGG